MYKKPPLDRSKNRPSKKEATSIKKKLNDGSLNKKIEVKEKVNIAQTKPKVTENLLEFDFDPQPSKEHPTLLV
jgi:hypothetical protein